MYALGVDLGTTYLAAAVWRDGRAETVALGNRAHAVPAVVLLDADGSVVVGEPARLQALTSPDRAAAEFKRRFGDDVGYWLGDQEISAEALTEHALRWVVRTVLAREGGPPAHLAVTVPATWQEYRQRLIGAVQERVAGQVVAQLTPRGWVTPPTPAPTTTLPEPAAAAVYYAGQRPIPAGTTIGVYDLGGGTMDATVLRKTDGGFEILGQPVGSDCLGGVDIDHALLQVVDRKLGNRLHELDRSDPAVRIGLAGLRSAVVEAKESLSAATTATVPMVLPGLITQVELTRDELEQEITPIVQASIGVLEFATETAGTTVTGLDAVLLVGGSSRIPLVARLLTERLGVPVTVDAHPKFAVCLGAAISAGAALGDADTRRLPAVPTRLPPTVPTRPPRTEPPPEQLPPEQLPPEPIAAPTIEVNLASAGLTEADQVPRRPAVPVELRLRAAAPRPDPLRIDLAQDAGYRGAARRSAALVAGLVVAVLLAAVGLRLLAG